jgi:hypothetical protein
MVCCFGRASGAAAAGSREVRVHGVVLCAVPSKLLREVENELLQKCEQEPLQKEHSGCAALLRDDKVRLVCCDA